MLDESPVTLGIIIKRILVVLGLLFIIAHTFNCINHTVDNDPRQKVPAKTTIEQIDNTKTNNE
ncbi:MAG: hypothetical protein RR594_03330 [Clostridia bacterium]